MCLARPLVPARSCRGKGPSQTRPRLVVAPPFKSVSSRGPAFALYLQAVHPLRVDPHAAQRALRPSAYPKPAIVHEPDVGAPPCAAIRLDIHAEPGTPSCTGTARTASTVLAPHDCKPPLVLDRPIALCCRNCPLHAVRRTPAVCLSHAARRLLSPARPPTGPCDKQQKPRVW